MSGAWRFWLWGGDYGGAFTALVVVGCLALFAWCAWQERREESLRQGRLRDAWNSRYATALWGDAVSGDSVARDHLVAVFSGWLNDPRNLAELSRPRESARLVDWQQKGWWTE